MAIFYTISKSNIDNETHGTLQHPNMKPQKSVSLQKVFVSLAAGYRSGSGRSNTSGDSLSVMVPKSTTADTKHERGNSDNIYDVSVLNLNVQ